MGAHYRTISDYWLIISLVQLKRVDLDQPTLEGLGKVVKRTLYYLAQDVTTPLRTRNNPASAIDQIESHPQPNKGNQDEQDATPTNKDRSRQYPLTDRNSNDPLVS
jgi:hypothetical protein